MKRTLKLNTPEKEAAIQRGIAQDPDAAELDESFFAKARPAAEVMSPELYAELTKRRGPGKKPAKVPVTLRLDADVLAELRASGPGWQSRVNATLRSSLAHKEPAAKATSDH